MHTKSTRVDCGQHKSCVNYLHWACDGCSRAIPRIVRTDYPNAVVFKMPDGTYVEQRRGTGIYSKIKVLNDEEVAVLIL